MIFIKTNQNMLHTGDFELICFLSRKLMNKIYTTSDIAPTELFKTKNNASKDPQSQSPTITVTSGVTADNISD